jgi:hypothetical protein
MEYIAFDSHKRYTFASVEEHTGNILRDARIDHHRGAITEFLSVWKTGTEVAVETTGNWYWIVDEIEAASDAFGKRGRKEIEKLFGVLPPHSRFSVERLLEQLDVVQDHIQQFEGRMKKVPCRS